MPLLKVSNRYRLVLYMDDEVPVCHRRTHLYLSRSLMFDLFRCLIGRVTISRHTCVKSGKKLVWNKGVSLRTTPAPSPSPKPSSTSTPSKIEIKAGDQCLSSERGSLRTTANGTFICQHDNSEAFRWFAADPATNSSTQTPSPSPTSSASPTKSGQSSSEYFESVYKDLTNYLSPDHNNLRITWHISENANAKPHQKYMESVELGARIVTGKQIGRAHV